MAKLLQKMMNKLNYIKMTYYFYCYFTLNSNNFVSLFNKFYNEINNNIQI